MPSPLANCNAGQAARYEQRAWSLPRAFLAAGASAVVASLVPVLDGDGGALFARIGDTIAAGESPAVAVARVRAESLAADPASWVRHLVVFE